MTTNVGPSSRSFRPARGRLCSPVYWRASPAFRTTPAQERREFVARVANPVVHRVRDDQVRRGDLVHHLVLKRGRTVRQEDVLRVEKPVGQLPVEFPQDVQLDRERLGFVHRPFVASSPAEGLAARSPDAAHVHVPPAQLVEVLLGEIVTHHARHPHRRKEARRVGEIHRRPAQHVGHLAVRRPDRIERDGADNQERHLSLLIGGQAFLPVVSRCSPGPLWPGRLKHRTRARTTQHRVCHGWLVQPCTITLTLTLSLQGRGDRSSYVPKRSRASFIRASDRSRPRSISVS